MTAAEMAALYAAAFPASRAWSADEISDLIDGPGGFAVSQEQGFALGRAIAGEAELITIAVSPDARRKGTGGALLAQFEAEAQVRGAETAFLEVAADNAAALALYRAAGWAETGRRAGYYARPTGAVDALTFAKPLEPLAPASRKA
jgi:ribosomal-protein-alanine N-acetyltransferase